jgi:hypothetical protein
VSEHDRGWTWIAQGRPVPLEEISGVINGFGLLRI